MIKKAFVLLLGTLLIVIAFVGFSAHAKQSEIVWPPQIGQPYPDIEVVDHRGETKQLSSFKGTVLLIEPIGMNCPACNAWSGAHFVGGYDGIQPQAGLLSIREYLPKYTGGIKIDDARIKVIQLLLYDMRMKAPSRKDAIKWAEHFGFDELENHYVVVPTQSMISPASYNLIPGFQLVDKDFILRSDSTGHHPKDNLYTKLLPMVSKYVHRGSRLRKQKE